MQQGRFWREHLSQDCSDAERKWGEMARMTLSGARIGYTERQDHRDASCEGLKTADATPLGGDVFAFGLRDGRWS